MELIWEVLGGSGAAFETVVNWGTKDTVDLLPVKVAMPELMRLVVKLLMNDGVEVAGGSCGELVTGT